MARKEKQDINTISDEIERKLKEMVEKDMDMDLNDMDINDDDLDDLGSFQEEVDLGEVSATDDEPDLYDLKRPEIIKYAKKMKLYDKSLAGITDLDELRELLYVRMEQEQNDDGNFDDSAEKSDDDILDNLETKGELIKFAKEKEVHEISMNRVTDLDELRELIRAAINDDFAGEGLNINEDDIDVTEIINDDDDNVSEEIDVSDYSKGQLLKLIKESALAIDKPAAIPLKTLREKVQKLLSQENEVEDEIEDEIAEGDEFPDWDTLTEDRLWYYISLWELEDRLEDSPTVEDLRELLWDASYDDDVDTVMPTSSKKKASKKPDFSKMKKPECIEWAKNNNIRIPTKIKAVADIRDFLQDYDDDDDNGIADYISEEELDAYRKLADTIVININDSADVIDQFKDDPDSYSDLSTIQDFLGYVEESIKALTEMSEKINIRISELE